MFIIICFVFGSGHAVGSERGFHKQATIVCYINDLCHTIDRHLNGWTDERTISAVVSAEIHVGFSAGIEIQFALTSNTHTEGRGRGLIIFLCSHSTTLISNCFTVWLGGCWCSCETLMPTLCEQIVRVAIHSMPQNCSTQCHCAVSQCS